MFSENVGKEIVSQSYILKNARIHLYRNVAYFHISLAAQFKAEPVDQLKKLMDSPSAMTVADAEAVSLIKGVSSVHIKFTCPGFIYPGFNKVSPWLVNDSLVTCHCH